jgi:streptomycin 6-kinase
MVARPPAARHSAESAITTGPLQCELVIRVPERLAERFARDEGAAGRAWVAELPNLVQRYCRAWSLRPDGPPMHGFVALALPVLRADDTPAVLKISWRDRETVDEPVALATWQGHGAALLLDRDDEHGALLLERLDHTRTLDTEPIGEAVTVAGGLLRRLSVPAPRSLRLRLPEVAERWRAELPAENANLGRPVPESLLDKAIGYCAELGPQAAELMVNADLHYQNVLRGQREPWLLIDPKVLVGDPEFGLIPLLWNRFELMDGERGIHARLAELVDVAGLDARRALGWTLVRAVDTWLWALAHGGFPDAEICARLALALGR